MPMAEKLKKEMDRYFRETPKEQLEKDMAKVINHILNIRNDNKGGRG